MTKKSPPSIIALDGPAASGKSTLGRRIADTLGYLSMGALRESVGDHDFRYCYACYTGNYPTELINIEELKQSRANC